MSLCFLAGPLFSLHPQCGTSQKLLFFRSPLSEDGHIMPPNYDMDL